MKIKLVRMKSDGAVSVAMLQENRWIPLKPLLVDLWCAGIDNAEKICTDILSFLQCGSDTRKRIEELLLESAASTQGSVEEIVDIPLIPFHPLSYRDFMLYEEHLVNASRGFAKRFMPGTYRVLAAYEKMTGRTFPMLKPKKIWYRKPIYYMGNHLSFVTEGETIPIPSYCTELDYELELGFLISRPLRNASPDEALGALGGFVILNDFSARDVQKDEMTSGFGPVKAKNFANAISAVVVTADEIVPHLDEMTAEVRINGDLVGTGSSGGRQHSIGEAIAYASLDEQIYPGEFMASGTIPGCSGMENGHMLKSGDKIELRLERIGTLTNTIE